MAHFETVVVGSGPGGYVAAIRSAQLGRATAVIEADRIGGRCLNSACIPAKALLRAADVLAEIRNAGEFGITVGEPTVDFAAVSARRAAVIAGLTGGVAGLLSKNKVETIAGRAALMADGALVVTDPDGGRREVTADAIVLATGSTARALPGVPFGTRVIDTEQAWALTELPETMAVVGAGASGAEIASAFARLGTSVLLFEGLERVLPTEDADISKAVARGFKKDGIAVHVSTRIADVEEVDGGVRFTHGQETVQVQWLVVAAGRGADVDGLGLDAAGIALDDRGLIAADERLRTSRAGVWAIGDLVAGPALAHKASDEGIIAVEDAAGHAVHGLDHVDIPRATFCSPNVASFGLTEAEARAGDHDVVVGSVPYGAVGAGTVHGDRTGLVKLVGDRRYGEILGAHVVGAKATELIQELVNAKALDGGYPEVARAVHGHPTMSEAILEAARAADGWLVHG